MLLRHTEPGAAGTGLARCVTLVAALLLTRPVDAVTQSPTLQSSADSEAEGLPLVPSRTVRFRVTEGTWLSLDVSPDGRTLVFDLLGDLYTLPITGGKAVRITSGMARNRQPRFSPDGQSLVFVSDRGGSENIWISKRDGSSARQLSRLRGYDGWSPVVSPVWSPDGRSIIASQRLGALNPCPSVCDGENPATRDVFLLAAYEAKTGAMRWISDTTPDAVHPMLGPSFGARPNELYAARDEGFPNRSALVDWSIVRIDFKTGRVFSETNAAKESRAGMRPELSPSGRYLIYASSSGTHMGLRIRDLATDRERWLVQERLDGPQSWGERDLLPGYAFTPDSKSIVAGFGGKIHRIDLASGRVVVIPFVAEVERKLGPLTLYQFPLADTAVRTRAVVQPALSPDGSQVAFSALDRVWIMDVPPDGQPAAPPWRLTADSIGEFYPSWSPDGDWITYATWRDGEGGSIRRARATRAPQSPGSPERLTEDTALYVNPVFSPKGDRVVAVRMEAPPERELTNPLTFYPAEPIEPALVWVPVKGGSSRRITSLSAVSGYYMRYPVRQVYFTGDADRVYVGLTSWRWDGTDQRLALALVGRDGSVSSEMEPMDIAGVLSPSGTEALVARRFEIYEAKLARPAPGAPQRTDTLDLERPSRSVTAAANPVAKRWGVALAPWISWSADGRRVVFQQGGVLFVGDRGAGAWTTFRRVEVPLFVAPDIPRGTLLLRGARVVTMRGGEIIPRGDVLVRDNRIAGVGASNSFPVPPGTRILDVSGTTILPGYVDIHDHLVPPQGVHAGQSWRNLLQLAYGVTSSRDPAANMDNDVFTYAERERTGDLLGPRLFSTGIPEYGTDPPTRSLDDARAFVRPFAQDFRTETFKIYTDHLSDRRGRQLLTKASAAAGLNATAHTNGVEEALASVLDGLSGIEHAPDIPIYDDVASLVGRSGTTQTHTYVIQAGSLQYMARRHGLPTDRAKVRRFVPPSARRATCASCAGDVLAVWGTVPLDNVRPMLRGAARIVARGGRVAMGAHGSAPGLGFHWEMWLHALGGMPNHEILRSATIVGAEAIGHGGDLGSIDRGKLADFQVIRGNPLDDIHNTENVLYVMKNGRLYQAEDLTEVWPRHRPLAANYLWEPTPPADSITRALLRPQ